MQRIKIKDIYIYIYISTQNDLPWKIPERGCWKTAEGMIPSSLIIVNYSQIIHTNCKSDYKILACTSG